MARPERRKRSAAKARKAPIGRGASGDRSLLEAFWSESVSRTVLPNGLTLIVKADDSAALASVQVWVRTGSIHEGDHLGAGLSHFLEHMLFKGTSRRSGREISASVQAAGGYINAYTTFDRTVYYIDLPSESVGLAIDVLADATLNSTLPAEEVAKERDVILREIAMTKDDADNRLWDALFSIAFREHPYRQPIIGHRDVFSAVSREDLAAYYRARYVPNNLVVVVVGDVDVAAVRSAVDQHFGAAPRSRLAPVLVPAEPPQLAPRVEHRHEDVEVTRCVLAWPIPGLVHDDSPALDLLATILGHGDSSVLWREVRDRQGLVHSIDASAWNPGSSGLFCVSFTCDPAKRDAARRAVEGLLGGLARRPIAAVERRKAVRQLVVGEINTRKTMSGQASRLGVAEVVVGDLDHSRGYFERLASLTSDDLRSAVTRHLAPERMTVVSSNPRANSAVTPGPARGGAARPDFSEVRLANGARILLQPDRRLPNVHFRLLMEGGALHETPGFRGSTGLLGTLLTKDTRRRTAADVARLVEEVGGAIFPFSGNNSVGFGVEVLPPDIGRALDTLGGALLEPAFSPGTFEVEREAQVAALQQDEDDVVTYGRKRLRERFFGSHPLALDAAGDIGGTKALTPADIAALHRSLAVGGNVVAAVSGDFDPERMERELSRILKRLPSGRVSRKTPACPGPSMPFDPGAFTLHQPREQAVVLQGFPGPAVNEGDFHAGEVADELFSGMAARLFERVREEKGLAYFVRSGRVTGLDTGMFYFIAGTQPGREEEVLTEIDAEIARVAAGGVEAAELARCVARLKAARRQSLQTNSARAMQAGLNALQGQPVNDWRNYDARVEAVNAAMLAEFATRRLAPARRVRLVVRPE